MEKSMKKILYPVAAATMIVVYILSVIRGGFAKTAAGLPIPDTGLTIPLLVYLAFSAVEIITENKNFGILPVVAFLIVKAVIYGLTLYLLCGYALKGSYISSNITGNFGDNLRYSVMVISYIVIPSVVLIFQVLSLFKRNHEKS